VPKHIVVSRIFTRREDINMRNRGLSFGLLLAALAVFPFLYAQTPARSGAEKTPTAPSGASVPDLSGNWLVKGGMVSWDPTDPDGKKPAEMAMAPWARQKLEAARPPFGARATFDNVTDPVQKYCDPPGVTRLYGYPYQFMFVQTPNVVYILYEYTRVWRLIPLNQEHPKDPDPSWMGDSVGRYEGDTLVIDTIGFNDKTWIDMVGHPHSEALHLVERIRRVDHDTLEVEVNFDDPKTYPKPFSGKRTFKLSPAPMAEALCSLTEMQAFQDEVMKTTVTPKK
jgi:hypothetical protein